MPGEHYSPLRYPGGKNALSSFIERIIEINDVEEGVYVEPFAGGSGAALSLLFSEKVHKVLLNDKDHLIYCFWKSVLDKTDELVQKIIDTPVNIKEYHRQKEILKSPKSKFTILEKGFAAFFLNRCNRSGILKAGPIGGNDQKGKWKIDARYNKEDLVRRIKRIAIYSDRIELYNYDAIEFIEKYLIHMPIKNEKVLIYLDPPYYKKGNSLYIEYFKKEDHIRFAEYFRGLDQFRWIISYDDSKFIRELYSDKNQGFLSFNYFANKAKIGRELMIYSEDCEMPEEYRIVEETKELNNKSIYTYQITGY